MSRDARIALRHGAGGPAMRELVRSVFARSPVAASEDLVGLAQLDDGAAVRVGESWLVFTTDTHVVKPPFFAGGDIGRLAVSGTVNDLAMMGATEPLGLACAVSDVGTGQRNHQEAIVEVAYEFERLFDIFLAETAQAHLAGVVDLEVFV